MYRLAYIFLITFFISSVYGQESVDSLDYNAKQYFQKDRPVNRSAHSRAALSLPFVDDFSYNSTFPDPAKWMNSGVYVNADFPIHPPSVGVATFDGLKADGRPYGQPGEYGGADTLQSQEIDLSSFTIADSIYFSFFFQPQGYGNPPEFRDSIILEFKKASGKWKKVWQGTIINLQIDSFYFKMIPVFDTFYFIPDFQFRFRNYASLTGNVDHWHIDFIILDKDRTQANPLLNDVSFYNNGRPLLKNYHSMPLDQFIGFEQQELADSLYVFSNNNFNIVKNTTFSYDAFEDCNNSTVNADFFQTINFPPVSDTILAEQNYKNEIINLVNSISCDSLVITTRYFLQNSPPDPGTAFNDTVVHFQRFYNYLAYDDGTAEVAYRLQGRGAQFAYKFKLNVGDSLRAIRVHFAHIDIDQSSNVINLIIWKKLDFPSGAQDEILYRKDLLKPVYTDSVNGFHTYLLDSVMFVSDSVYVGFQQDKADNFRIGMDRNNVFNKNLFYYVSGSWKQSTIPGALMVRLVLGDSLPVGINTIKPAFISVYPNPVDQWLNINTELLNQPVMAQVYSIAGQLMLQENLASRQLDVSALPIGLYLLHLTDDKGRQYISRFVVMHK
jgi:Secretion system C-terminal sorting domain